MERQWCIADLVTDHKTGKLRESSVFSVLGKGVVLWQYVTHVTALQFETMTLVVAGVVIGHEAWSRWMNAKVAGAPPGAPPPPQEKPR